jgi:hypothetical protein
VPTFHFRVQTRLVDILSRFYRSSEEALKELVANSWDADATWVQITLPLAFAGKPIVVRDDGCGMTPQELEAHYLEVALDRRRLSGETTPNGRPVRGQLGIGKFAGFVAADQMVVTTVARGKRSRLVLNRKDLQSRDEDLEKVNLPIDVVPSDDPPGTTIELSLPRPGFEQPSPKKLGSILLREFGFKDTFAIFIDGNRLTPDALEGKKIQLDLPSPAVLRRRSRHGSSPGSEMSRIRVSFSVWTIVWWGRRPILASRTIQRYRGAYSGASMARSGRTT